MWRETFFILYLHVFTIIVGANDNGNNIETISVDSDPSMYINELDLLDHSDHELQAPTTSNIITCPLVGGGSISLGSGSFILKVPTKTLCSLNKAVTSPETGDVTLIPIARSYDGNEWEQAAGKYAFSLFHDNDILCYTEGCKVKLPPLEEDSEYLLTTSTYSLSEKDEYARFLETASFGITEEQLDDFEASSLNIGENIINWLSDQMNASIVHMTSHREFWRKGVNNRVS